MLLTRCYLFLIIMLFTILPSLAMNNYFFSINPIPENIQKEMQFYTWQDYCPVAISDLAYLQLSYWGFDQQTHVGDLIVNKQISNEVVAIFKELYLAHFPIAQMTIIENFQGDDNRSMAANNTSAFNCRPIVGSNRLSKHAYGLAIDINPVYNPYINGSVVLPSNAKNYTDRTLNQAGMITHDSVAYKIFKHFGWTWGGDWQNPKDYQHFEKDIVS